MNVNFELYKVFYEVVIAGSISKGSEKLLISQPAVTKSIKNLEEELGGKLFIRTPKGVKLKNEGQELFNYIKEGMNYFINGTNKFASLKNLDEGILNIGATTTISEHILIPYIKTFHEKYPKITINIINNLTENLIKELRVGSLDIIVTAIPNYKINDIKYKKITDLHSIFVGSNKYKNKIYKIEDLLKENILVQKSPSITRVNFNNFLKENNLSCTPKMEVISHSLLTTLTESDFGISILIKEYIENKLNKTLFGIKTNQKIPNTTLGYALKNDSVPSFTVTKFIEILNSQNIKK